MQHGSGMHMGLGTRKIVSFETTYRGKRQIAEGTFEYTFDKPKGLRFQAGQHVRMAVINPSEMDAEGDKRFFTMASTPQDSDLKFAWRVRNTAFKRVMQQMQPGQKVLIQKRSGEAPQGSFVLHDDANIPAVFIAGGIGIVPAYAMIKDAMQRGLTHKMYLFYSNRRPEDAPYLSELQDMAKKNPRLEVIATMTEVEKSTQKWRGERGIINRAMIEKYVSNPHDSIFYVAGLTDMVTAMQDVLAEMSIDKATIRAEEFAGFKMGEGMHGPSGVFSRTKNFLLITGIVFVVIAIIFVRMSGISHTDFTSMSFNNPLLYLLLLLILAALISKIFMAMWLKNSIRSKLRNQKLPARNSKKKEPTS